MYQLSPGHRVTWVHDFTEVKAQITRIWKNKAEILTTDFQRLKVPLEELELVPVVAKPKGDRSLEGVREQPEDAIAQSCTLTDSSLHESVREQKTDCTLTDCTLTTEESDRTALHPNSWIEEKQIRRSGKLHGPYLYERWRDAQGKMKSKYLGKKQG